MTIPVVVVPIGADIAGIGFEEQLRHGEDAAAGGAADRAGGGVGGLAPGPRQVEMGVAFGTGVGIGRHSGRSPVSSVAAQAMVIRWPVM